MKKAIKDGLNYLGKDYSVQIIDFGECIYRNFGDYDVEVIHTKQRAVVDKGYTIYVWSKEPLRVIKSYKGIENLQALKEVLDRVEKDYAGKTDRI